MVCYESIHSWVFHAITDCILDKVVIRIVPYWALGDRVSQI